MKLKLDENLGQRGIELFRSAGHDVATVDEQNLSGADDRTVIDICHRETRALVTLDMDFSNPLEFPPEQFSGIAVVRLPARFLPTDLWLACSTLIRTLEANELTGRLWIVQRDRVREYRPSSGPQP